MAVILLFCKIPLNLIVTGLTGQPEELLLLLNQVGHIECLYINAIDMILLDKPVGVFQ